MEAIKKIINEAVDNVFANRVNSGDMLGEKCYIYLSINAQKGFGSNLLTVNSEKKEVLFKNGARILYDIIDPSEDVIEWRLLNRKGNVIELSDEIKNKIEDELLDLLVSQSPAEYRQDDDIPGDEIGMATKEMREKDLQEIKENFNRLTGIIL